MHTGVCSFQIEKYLMTQCFFFHFAEQWIPGLVPESQAMFKGMFPTIVSVFFFLINFRMSVKSQEAAKLVERNHMYCSPSFHQCLYLYICSTIRQAENHH